MTLEEAKAAGFSIILWPEGEGVAGWTTPHGTRLIIESVWDWVVFGDVWINQEYRFHLKATPGGRVKIYDFGANVGYFSLFAADRCKAAGVEYEIHAFEPDPKTFATLRDRTQDDSTIILYNLAVGKHGGGGLLAPSFNHATSLLVNSGDDYPNKEKVNYAVLEDLIEDYQNVDLIKCDIEGSEYDLIESYPDLIRNCPLVFMEIHFLDQADKIYRFMEAAGFKRHTVRQHTGTVSEVFYKV